MSLSSFGAFDDDMEEGGRYGVGDEGADEREQEFECGLFIYSPFLWGVTRDPEFPKVSGLPTYSIHIVAYQQTHYRGHRSIHCQLDPADLFTTHHEHP